MRSLNIMSLNSQRGKIFCWGVSKLVQEEITGEAAAAQVGEKIRTCYVYIDHGQIKKEGRKEGSRMHVQFM